MPAELLDTLGAGSHDDLAAFARRVAERALADRSWSSGGGPAVAFAYDVWHDAAWTVQPEFCGGRLILTEVRAAERERHGLFRASPDGGRLLLRFADDTDSASDPDDGCGEPPEAAASSAVGGGGGFNGGELCQVAAAGVAGRTRVEVGAVIEI